jgi:hypothetical protein
LRFPLLSTAAIGRQLLDRAPDCSWPDVSLTIEAGELILERIGLRAPAAAWHAGTCTWPVEATLFDRLHPEATV